MSEKGLFPMRSWHGKEYNIFLLPDGKYEGRVFDKNRRVYCKTTPCATVEIAIDRARSDCVLYAKGMFVSGIIVDEGKPIREKEDKEYLDYKKSIKKINVARKKGS